MRYPYSPKSLQRLKSCHDDLVLIFKNVAEEVDTTIICGHRSKTAQTEAFDLGHSKVEFPNSKHNSFPSMAVDAGPYLGGIQWDDAKSFAVFAGRVLSITERLYKEGLITHKIRWGGDWDSDGSTDDQTFNDLPHFELVKP